MSSTKSSSWRPFALAGTVVALALTGGLLYWKFHPEQAKMIWPTLQNFLGESPYNATTPADAERWPNSGQGLSLTVQNALESKYTEYFTAAVSDWENGTPDCLTLTETTGTPGSDCDPVDGILKVCNGNYGATGWYGINYVLTDGIYISSSQAEMNDYYLDKSTSDRKQYTMCHEIGHGFGLPHTDESFWNRNQGNCLDYTEFPSSDKHPGLVNYEFLYDLYGLVPGATWNGTTDNSSGTSNGSSSNTNTNTNNVGYTNGNNGNINNGNSQGNNNGNNGGITNDDSTNDDTADDGGFQSSNGNNANINNNGRGGNRIRRRLINGLPERVFKRWQDIRAMEHRMDESFTGRRMLHQNEFGMGYEIDLPEGYTLRVSKLLTRGDDM